mgnify:CR=1 FL=1
MQLPKATKPFQELNSRNHGARKQRLPTEVEDVTSWIPRVSSKDSRIRHVRIGRFQGRRHRGVVRRRSHPQATGPNRDYIKSPILRPARCVHQHGLQAEFVLRVSRRGREGIGQRWGSGGDGTTYRRPRCIRGGARVAPGVPARDTPARSKGRTFAPSWLFLGWIRESGRGALTVSWLRSFVHHLCVFVG